MNIPPRPAGEVKPAEAGKTSAMRAGLVLLAGLVVGFVAGYGAGRVSTGAVVGDKAMMKKGTYEEGFEAARMKLQESGFLPPAVTDIRTLSGSVKSVGDGSFVLESSFRNPNPLDEKKYPSERTVSATAETKIFRQEAKNPEEQQREFAAFQRALQQGQTGVVPPQPFNRVEIKLSELRPGDIVTATAAENILDAASFSATEIIVQSGTNLGPRG